MALFELEDGRLVPAQFGREVPEGFSEDVLQAVRMQVLEIVSRPLFPIAWSAGSGGDETAPRLTALDAAGQVVAVEVVRDLDADVLIEALSRLADSAAMSWTDLARQYPHGIEGFKRGWAQFRETMPTSPPNGPRMVLVAANVAPEVRPALDVLSSSGVEVHEMSLRQTSNGRAFLEVEPVGQRLYNHRFTPVLDSAGAVPSLAEASRKSRRAAGPSLEGVQSQDVLARRRRQGVGPLREESVGAAVEQQQSPPNGAGTPTLPEEEAQKPPRRAGAWVPLTRAQMATRREQAQPAAVQPPVAQSAPSRPQQAPSRAPEADVPALPTAPVSSPQAPRRTRSSRHKGTPLASWPQMQSRQQRRAQQRAEEAGPKTLTLDASGLAGLAQMLGDDVPLSLRPANRGPRGALLSLEGQIIVPAGAFTDPSQALRAMGIYGEDGWGAWHLGDERGPTLRESIEEINRER